MGKGKRSQQRLARELCAGPGALMPDEVRAGAGVLVLDAGELRAFMELTDGLFAGESGGAEGGGGARRRGPAPAGFSLPRGREVAPSGVRFVGRWWVAEHCEGPIRIYGPVE